MNKRKLADYGTNCCNILKRAKIPAKEALEENAIRYYLMPSLEHLSAVRIIITLWSRKHIQKEIIKLCSKRSLDYKVYDRFNEPPHVNKFGKKIKNKISHMVLALSEFDTIIRILTDLVDPIGQEIFDWIDYNEKYVYPITLTFLYQEVNNYLDCLIWTSRGVIDYRKTAKELLARRFVLYTNRYNVACSYCLEDDIANLSNDLHDLRLYSNLSYGFKKPMIDFWGAQITGAVTRLNEEVNIYNIEHKTKYNINELLFLKLAKEHKNNQVAIKFMWNMLSDDEKSREIWSVIKYSNADLKCFFLSQMSKAQQKQVFGVNSRYMLLCLLDNWLWKDYFLPTMHYVWNVIPAMDFLCVVEDIVICRMKEQNEKAVEYYRYKTIFKEVWQSAPIHLKEFIFDFQNGSRSSSIFFGLLCEKNIDIIQLMLSEMNEIQKKNMIFSSTTRHYHKCYSLIVNDQIDVVKMFIDNTLYTDEDKDKFKRLLVENHGCDIVVHFEQNQERDKAEKFLQWVFMSDDDIRKFKAKLAYSKVCEDILESIVADDSEKDFMKLDNFFQWCASGNTQNVVQIKEKMHEVYFTKVICKLIEEDKYELLEKFLNWCFPNSKRKIGWIKHNFYSHKNYSQMIQLILNLVDKNNQLQSLKKFSSLCFDKKTDITKFKNWIMEAGSKDTVGVCIELLCKVKFNLADEIVKWCCNSNHFKVTKFKKDLMLHDNIKNLFTLFKHNDEVLVKIIKWFNPSKEIIIQFKKKFSELHWLKHSDIAVLLIKNQKWVEVEHYIQWAFESDSDKKKFKEKLAYGKVCDGILKSILADDNVDFVELENFFLWCASGKAETVGKLKREIYRKYFTTVVCRLIEEDKYHLLDIFLNWCFMKDKQWITWFKHLFCGSYKYVETVKLVLHLILRNDQLKSLEKFAQWCFVKNSEIVKFKEFILKPSFMDKVGVCIELMDRGMLKSADEFVHWCCDSSQIKIDEFKNTLMLDSGVISLFNRCKYRSEFLRKIIKWFKPSAEMKMQFRKKFEDEMWIERILPVMDFRDRLWPIEYNFREEDFRLDVEREDLW